MTRTLLACVAALALAACPAHPPGAIEVSAGDCVACHLPDYNGTTAPVHATEGFPTTCGDCHSTTSWNVVHPEANFPIQSGPHNGIACAQCHDASLGSNAYKGANTNCIACHTHNQTDTNGHHDGVDGYSWDPAHPHNCLACHPSGGPASD